MITFAKDAEKSSIKGEEPRALPHYLFERPNEDSLLTVNPGDFL